MFRGAKWPAFVVALSIISTSASFAKSWEDAIAEVEELSSKLYEYGNQFSPGFLGTLYNEVDVDKHQCAILGRLVGRQEDVAHLEEIDVPKPEGELSENEGHNMKVIATSLSNWAHIASNIIELSDVERGELWNLNCVGTLGISTSALVETENDRASFRIEGETLFVLGAIETGFANELAQKIAEAPQITTIALGSAGGSVKDAIDAGAMIRALDLDTTLYGNCFSACPLVFIGGKRRTIWSPYPDLGFHRLYRENGEPIYPGHKMYSALANYFASMGVNPKTALASIFAAEPEQVYVPKLSTLCENGFATWVQRVCIRD